MIMNYKTTTYIIKTSKNIGEDKTFLVLSDLHDACYGKNNTEILSTINHISCDTVIVAGDMITGKRKADWSVTEKFICELAMNHKIYYINGNHESRCAEYPEKYGDKYEGYKDRLIKHGVIFLENQSYTEENISITGYEIEEKYYKKFKKQNISEYEIKEKIGLADDRQYNILVAHNPRYIDDYVNWNPDLIISGHFHGGMVRIPGVGGVLSPQCDIFPKYSGGHYKCGDTDVVVSCGLGSHTIPIRIFNKPEIIKIVLQK